MSSELPDMVCPSSWSLFLLLFFLLEESFEAWIIYSMHFMSFFLAINFWLNHSLLGILFLRWHLSADLPGFMQHQKISSLCSSLNFLLLLGIFLQSKFYFTLFSYFIFHWKPSKTCFASSIIFGDLSFLGPFDPTNILAYLHSFSYWYSWYWQK